MGWPIASILSLVRNQTTAELPTEILFRHRPFAGLRRHGRGSVMYRKHLEAMEMRERAFAARDKSERARRLSARGAKALDRQARNLDERAAGLEQESRRVESGILPPAPPAREPRD
jgi:hypothetical protein